MQHLSIRFLIGLSKASDPGPSPFQGVYDARSETALAILAREYPGLSSWRGVGYWRGQPEPSLTVETVVESIEDNNVPSGWQNPDGNDTIGRAQSLAGEVARALGQEAVGVVVQPVSFTLEGPHATEGPAESDDWTTSMPAESDGARAARHARQDSRHLDTIAGMLSGAEWTPEVLDEVAREVRASGRVVADVA
jgi:hypothetical protein